MNLLSKAFCDAAHFTCILIILHQLVYSNYGIIIHHCYYIMFLFALSVCWRAPTVSLFTPSVNTEVAQTFIFCCYESETSLSDSLRRWPLTFSCCYSLRFSLQLNVCGGSTCSSPVPKPPPCSPPQPPDLRGGWTDQSGSDLNLSDVSLCLKFLTDWHPDGCECEAEFCSAHSRKQNCDLNWRGNFPVLMSLKKTVYSLWCQRKGPVVTYISRD